MRYLWVEDFDGGKSGKTEIKKSLEQYFGLADKNINITTLEQALDFLEKPFNWNLFDAILLDIRFKVCEKEKDEIEIYKKYFSSFLTKEKYEYYISKLEGDANTASSGVLLYLALIHRYHYNQKRIAFISANVDDTSEDFSDINNMRECLAKAKYDGINEDDKNDFSALNENVFELYIKVLGIGEETANKRFALPETDKINWNDLDILSAQVDLVENEMKAAYIAKNKKSADFSKNNTNLKYNSVKSEFEKVGLKIPIAFEKPSGSYKMELSWKFKIWVEEINTDYYRLRASIVPICLKLIEGINKDKDNILYQPYIQIVKGNIKQDQENENAKNELLGLFSDIIELFPGNVWVEKKDSLYFRVIKECVSLCESMQKPDPLLEKDSYKYACQAVLKIARNWSSHQGIQGISAYDVVFIFHIFINTFMNIDNSTEIYNYNQIMIKDFCGTKDILPYKSVKEIIGRAEEKYRKEYKEADEKFRKEATEKELEKARKNHYKYDGKANFYDIISGIGNACSPIRREVSMQHLYALFLNNLKEENFSKESFFEHSVVNRIHNKIYPL